MARGILGRSRANRRGETISKPVLKYSDALPRDDLRDVDTGISYSHPMNQANGTAQRPKTSEGRQLKKKKEVPAPGFDFQIAVPPAECVRSSAGTDAAGNGTMIGIALGSPRLVEGQSVMAQMQNVPPPPIPDVEKRSNLSRKPSKWRKIGGLFRAKNAMTPSSSKPFYQVQADSEWPLQGSSHSIDYKSQYRADFQSNPIEHTEVWPCLETETDPRRRNGETHSTSEKKMGSGPFLQVEIPTVEMERYSVMFGGLLQRGQPSQLNRRSKTLDDLTAGNKEPASPLGPPRRRATSPTRSKSPSSSFTLFPTTQTSKASKVLGSQNMPNYPDPLRRNSPLVAPEHARAGSKGQLMLMVHSGPRGQASHQTQESVSSFLSSTTIGSEDESLLIHRLEPVRAYVDTKEPQWEIVNRKPPATITGLKPGQALTVNTQEIPSNPASDTSGSLSPILSPLPAPDPKDEQGKSPTGTKVAAAPPTPQFPPEEDPIPTIEVSIARSISVSKGRKQVLVPVRPRADRLNPDERLVARQAKTPRVTDAQHGHRHGNSQDVRIESL